MGQRPADWQEPPRRGMGVATALEDDFYRELIARAYPVRIRCQDGDTFTFTGATVKNVGATIAPLRWIP